MAIFFEFELMLFKFANLGSDSGVDEIREMLVNLSPGVDDGFNSRVENEQVALEVWGMLIASLFPNAPLPQSTEFIGSPRYQGYCLPESKVLFIFSADDCFTFVKTPTGEALDRMLGSETNLSSWTSYSC